jgi:hypothetical protein
VRYVDESTVLRTWRTYPRNRQLGVLASMRSDIWIFEEDHAGDQDMEAHAAALRAAHDALVVAGALGPDELIAAIEQRRARL